MLIFSIIFFLHVLLVYVYTLLCIYFEMLLLSLVCFSHPPLPLSSVLALFQSEFFLLSILPFSQNCVFFSLLLLFIFVIAVAIFCLRALTRANDCSMWCNIYLFSCPSLIYDIWMNVVYFCAANILSCEWKRQMNK